MAVSAQCPQCNFAFNAKDEYIGRKVRCPGCQQPVLITDRKTPPDTERDDDRSDDSPEEGVSNQVVRFATLAIVLAVALGSGLIAGHRFGRTEDASDLREAKNELAQSRQETEAA